MAYYDIHRSYKCDHWPCFPVWFKVTLSCITHIWRIKHHGYTRQLCTVWLICHRRQYVSDYTLSYSTQNIQVKTQMPGQAYYHILFSYMCNLLPHVCPMRDQLAVPLCDTMFSKGLVYHDHVWFRDGLFDTYGFASLRLTSSQRQSAVDVVLWEMP